MILIENILYATLKCACECCVCCVQQQIKSFKQSQQSEYTREGLIFVAVIQFVHFPLLLLLPVGTVLFGLLAQLDSKVLKLLFKIYNNLDMKILFYSIFMILKQNSLVPTKCVRFILMTVAYAALCSFLKPANEIRKLRYPQSLLWAIKVIIWMSYNLYESEAFFQVFQYARFAVAFVETIRDLAKVFQVNDRVKAAECCSTTLQFAFAICFEIMGSK
uniref:Uncharacterized protein n=1 Tax=Glossina austeni TaxID=7395 RepID=A0A1A9UZH4_GLOAU